tara:strand:+ start:406 stop:834 length:429 start_codon:yes stop_codon:yes gene_type:complete
MSSFSRRDAERVARVTRADEQRTISPYRVPMRRPGAKGTGRITDLVFAKHDEELPMASLSDDPDECEITAVEVAIFRMIPKDEDLKAGDSGIYKLGALTNAEDEPTTAVVANFSPSEVIPKDEWFAILPTNGKIKMATLWPC